MHSLMARKQSHAFLKPIFRKKIKLKIKSIAITFCFYPCTLQFYIYILKLLSFVYGPHKGCPPTFFPS